MSAKTTAVPTEMSLSVPAEVIEVFQKAENYLRETYGDSPTYIELMQFHLRGISAMGVVLDFERGAREALGYPPEDEGELSIDEKLLSL
jgi:hypothetical protein